MISRVISEGKFQAKMPAGKYKIAVNAQKSAGSRTQKGFDGKVEVLELKEEMIPERYNTKTELGAQINPGVNQLNLQLKSKTDKP